MLSKNSHGRPRLKNRNHTSDVSSQINDSLCYKCYSDEPPRELFKSIVIVWTDCEETCGRWFHKCCLSDSESYTCDSVQCDRKAIHSYVTQ